MKKGNTIIVPALLSCDFSQTRLLSATVNQNLQSRGGASELINFFHPQVFMKAIKTKGKGMRAGACPYYKE